MDLLFTFIGLFTGRSGRRTFWIGSALIFLAQAAIVLTTHNRLLADVVLTIPWLLLWWRRLHDLNLSGRWALAPVAVGFGAGFINGWQRAAREHASADVTLTSLPANWFESALQYPDAFVGGFWNGFSNAVVSEFAARPVTSTLTWVMTLALALLPGTSGPNRFDPVQKADV